MRPIKVIVADDEPDSLMTLTTLLSGEGHDVVALSSGAQVLEALDDFNPDVVLLDIAMPGMSGFEVATQIRRRCGEIRPLLIAVTGAYKKTSDKMLAEIVGFNHHVTKPYDPNQLLALVNS